jgi:hypothetical protein
LAAIFLFDPVPIGLSSLFDGALGTIGLVDEEGSKGFEYLAFQVIINSGYPGKMDN